MAGGPISFTQQPAEITADSLRFSPPRFSPEELVPHIAGTYGLWGELAPLSGERDQNFKFTLAEGDTFVLKISGASEDAAFVDFQVKALEHIRHVDPDIGVPVHITTIRGAVSTSITSGTGEIHALRLLTYVPGVPMIDLAPPGHAVIRKLGELQGRLCRALQDFEHPASTQFMPWDVMNGLVVSRRLRTEYLPDDLAERCRPDLARLEEEVLPRMHRLESQVIHNDAHSGNVMVDPDNPNELTGVIDFGDMVNRPLIVDIATSLASLFENDDDPEAVTCALLSGFGDHMKLGDEDIDLLQDAVLARLILSVELVTFRIRNGLDNSGDLERRELPRVITALERLLDVSPGRLASAWHQRGKGP